VTKNFWRSIGLRIGLYGDIFSEVQGFLLVLLSWGGLIFIVVSKHLSAQGTIGAERLATVESRQQMVLETLKDLRAQDAIQTNAFDAVDKEMHDLSLTVARIQAAQQSGDMNMYVLMLLVAANLGDSGLRRLSDWRSRVLKRAEGVL
jgi:hypothetical protein